MSPTRADSNVDPSGEKRRTASKGERSEILNQVYPRSKESKQVLFHTSRPLDRLQLKYCLEDCQIREISWRDQEEVNLSLFKELPLLTSLATVRIISGLP